MNTKEYQFDACWRRGKSFNASKVNTEIELMPVARIGLMEHPYFTEIGDKPAKLKPIPLQNLNKEDSYRDARSIRELNTPSRRNLQNPRLLRKKSLRALKNALQTKSDITGFKEVSGSIEFKTRVSALLNKSKEQPASHYHDKLDDISSHDEVSSEGNITPRSNISKQTNFSMSNNTNGSSHVHEQPDELEELDKDFLDLVVTNSEDAYKYESDSSEEASSSDVDDGANGGVAEMLNSARSDKEFKLPEALTALEQQEICIKEMISNSDKLTLESKEIMVDDSLTLEEKMNKINSLLDQFSKDVRKVSRATHKIKAELGNPRDWNAEYRNIMETRPKTVEEKLKKYKSIARLTQDFEYTAQMYGKIIISEVFWDNKYRTIKPLAVGGAAGGEKFVYNGILFKFAVDWKQIYQSDHAAMKAASQEMLSLMSIQDADIEGICTPLMCLVDYLGFRLVAISLLPVSSNTLIYGSDDGGNVVRAMNNEFNQKMILLGKKMNLAEHYAGMRRHFASNISMPADIEGHLGEDGRFYLLDTARVMPPTFPDKAVRGSFLFRLFRPEFVKSYSKSLSSDACSPAFDKHEPRRSNHIENIRIATEYLTNSVIPKAVVWLDKHAEKMSISEVLEYLHASGINFRYLPLVRKHSLSAHLKMVLLLEMVARGIKNRLWYLLRQAKRTLLQSMAEQSYKELIANTCNKILGALDPFKSEKFWQDLHGVLKEHFVGFPFFEELIHDLRDPKTKYAFAIFEGLCPTAKYGELNVPMVLHKCFTCSGSEEICSVCINTCHIALGHEVSNQPKRLTGFMCSCSQHADKCHSVKRLSQISANPAEDDNYLEIDNPIRYLMKKIGFGRLFKRVQELSGITFSKTSLDEIARNGGNYCFILPDIESLSAKIKRLPVVSVAESKNLKLRAQQLNNPKERMGYLKQSIGMIEEALRIYPGSETLMSSYVDICMETAFIAEGELADKLFFNAIRIYRVLKSKEKAIELLVRIKEDKKEVSPNIIQSLFDFIFNRSISPVTREDVLLVGLHGSGLQSLALDGLSLADDNTLKLIGVGCSQIISLSIGYCNKVTDEGIKYLFYHCGSKLRELYIDGNKLTDASLIEISQKCPNLVNLSIVTCEGFTDKGFKALSNLKMLSRLNMSWCSYNPKITSASLKSLLLVKNNVDLNGAKSLLKNCPNLQSLDLSLCSQLGNAAELLPNILAREKLSYIGLEKVTFSLTEKILREAKKGNVLGGTRRTILSDSIASNELYSLQELGFTVQKPYLNKPGVS